MPIVNGGSRTIPISFQITKLNMDRRKTLETGAITWREIGKLTVEKQAVCLLVLQIGNIMEVVRPGTTMTNAE